MLGEIDFKAWQCLCEIIDNSIDAFTDEEPGSRDTAPTVKIKLPAPSANQLSPDGVLEVADNGKGMTRDQLSKSLRAGFSGNDPIDKMGLFGMGFNISTARLGAKTEVITSTADSDHFLKVTIDFQELEKIDHFHVPVEVIPKKIEQRGEHGTTVRITKLRVDHHRPLYQKQRITKKLGKTYGRIIRQKGIRIIYNGSHCKPFAHCHWAASRVGQAKAGPVPAVNEIDRLIDEKRYCTTCWVWLSTREPSCPACGESSAISHRERRVKGWIGIQRYFDDTHYGIDLIRNGRVIRELDKSFFSWSNPNDDIEELEYPIDGHERKGRIIGELEIDFVKVTHQKDAFDVLSSDWNEVVRVVRGDGPIRPQIAKNQGYAENSSPLARLFSAFRTAKAGVKNLVPQRKNGQAMITDAHLDELVRKFNDGESGYDSDDKWWDLLNSNTGDAPSDSPAPSDDPTGGNPFASPDKPAAEGDLPEEQPVPESAPEELIDTEPDKELSRVYNLDFFPSISIRVIAEKAQKQPEANGFTVSARGAELKFIYWPAASIYTKSLLTPTDFLINELAYQLHTTAQNELSQVPITHIELALREKYFPELHPTLDELGRQIDLFETDLRDHLTELSSKLGGFSAEALSAEQRQLVTTKLAKSEYASKERIEETLASGEFINYISLEGLAQIVKQNPEYVFDKEFFSFALKEAAGTGLEEDLKRDLSLLLEDILWFRESARSPASIVWKGRMKRLTGSLEIASNWRVRP